MNPAHIQLTVSPRGQILKLWTARGNKKYGTLKGGICQEAPGSYVVAVALGWIRVLVWGPSFNCQGDLLSKPGTWPHQNLSLRSFLTM